MARRDQAAMIAAQRDSDISKVCQVLELQSLMDNLSEDVRVDFLNGTNGAVVSWGTIFSSSLHSIYQVAGKKLCRNVWGENADKCINYAENTLGYLEISTVNRIDEPDNSETKSTSWSLSINSSSLLYVICILRMHIIFALSFYGIFWQAFHHLHSFSIAFSLISCSESSTTISCQMPCCCLSCNIRWSDSSGWVASVARFCRIGLIPF